jgi:UDP-N-acetylmuramate dehydrogenase
MEFRTITRELEALIDVRSIKYNELMKNHTSFKVGGPADIFITPQKIEDLSKLVKFFNTKQIPYIVIGNGSNLLVRDGGLRSAVICLTDLNEIYTDDLKLCAGCGALLSATSNMALKNSLKGMEFASGIPGTVGGAVTMNAGAYGPEIKDVIECVSVMDVEGNIFKLKSEELEFTYRHSIIQKKNYIVVDAVFALEKGNSKDIKNRMDELNGRRSDKQPLCYPSAGSTFKRPNGYFAAKLIEDCGLKGLRIGGAMVSEKHSGFIINYENSSANDILELINKVEKTVKENYNINLETEVKIIGED